MNTFFLSSPVRCGVTLTSGWMIAAMMPSSHRTDLICIVAVMALNIVGNVYKVCKEAPGSNDPIFPKLLRNIAKDTIVSIFIGVGISRIAIWMDLMRHPEARNIYGNSFENQTRYHQAKEVALARYTQEVFEAAERYQETITRARARYDQVNFRLHERLVTHPALRDIIARMNYPFIAC